MRPAGAHIDSSYTSPERFLAASADYEDREETSTVSGADGNNGW